MEGHERGLVGSLALLHFFLIFGFTIAKSSRDGLYLGELSAQTLPYVYFGLAVATGLVSVVYDRFTNRLSADRTLAAGLLVTAISLVVFSILYRQGNIAVPITHYIWTGTYGLILISQFWALVAGCMIFDIVLFSRYYVPFEGLLHWSVHFVGPLFILTAFLGRKISELPSSRRYPLLAAIGLFLIFQLANNISVALECVRLLTD